MSIGKHTLANLAGSVAPMLVALVTVPHYLSAIGEERYGVLAVIWLLLAYFGFVDLGFGRAVAQRLAWLTDACAQERSRVVWTGVLASAAMGAGGGALLYFTANYLVAAHFTMSASMRQEAAGSVLWLAIALPLLIPGAICSGVLHARLRFREANVIQSCGAIAAQVLPLCVALSGRVELRVLVLTALLTRAFTTLALLAACWRHVPLQGPSIDREHLLGMVSYGKWVTLMNIVGALLVVIDRLAIATFAGARWVAHYSVPYDLVTRTTVLPASVSSAVFPRAAAVGDKEGRELALRASVVLLAIMTPIVVAGAVLIRPFLAFWVGQDFAAASAGVGEVLLLGIWVNAVAVPQHSRLLATGNARKLSINYVIELAAYVVALWIGVRVAGVLGAACAYTLRAALDALLVLRLNGTLRDSASSAMPSLTLLLAALALRFLAEPSYAQAFIAALIFAAVLHLHRRTYARVVLHLVSQGELRHTRHESDLRDAR
jgi:O-antigen/teichoic acid export membrane protein